VVLRDHGAENGEINARVVQIGMPAEDWSVQFMTDRPCRKAAEIERSGRLTLRNSTTPTAPTSP